MQASHADQSRLTRWATAPGGEIAPGLADHVAGGLFGSIPIFLGGVINSIVVAALAVERHPTWLFILWLASDLLLGVVRLAVLVWGARARKLGNRPPTGIAVLLSCAWAASVGYGAFISIASEDWVLATITCLSTAGMVSGICLRNFGTPRLVTLMMTLSLLPCVVAALGSTEPVLLIIAIQLPIYMAAIGSAAARLNAMLIARIEAQNALEQSEALNRSILDSSPDHMFLLDGNLRVVFCKMGGAAKGQDVPLGTAWLDLVPAESHPDALRALGRANHGEIARLTLARDDAAGRRWFDLALVGVGDGSGRILVSARDITHQKDSEERALWMANHDSLTGLPNRAVLQDFLERLPQRSRGVGCWALLVIDIDHFKWINDTLGHDAGDAMLCAFAQRLRMAVRGEDLVARLGGDEFAIVLRAATDADVGAAAEKIFEQLAQPFAHGGRPLECNASIGASFYPRHGETRSELMKAADMALYSAKLGGRGQLRIFTSAMRNEFQAKSSMTFLMRRALQLGHVFPHYQPKVDLKSGRIVGFEALLRWRDAAGKLRSPADVSAAFEDPALAAAISERMIGRTLEDIRAWLASGVEFGHVAINVAASDFRSGRFAQELLEKLKRAKIPTAKVQIEVTETVFLGRGADRVERALKRLSEAGLRIALDDFGTGYASLAQLMQFPVDALKIDQSFVRELGRKDDAEAIAKAIIGLGQSLDIEVIAEGVERSGQEVHLRNLGCRTAQGYLYSRAVPADTVGRMLAGTLARSA